MPHFLKITAYRHLLFKRKSRQTPRDARAVVRYTGKSKTYTLQTQAFLFKTKNDASFAQFRKSFVSFDIYAAAENYYFSAVQTARAEFTF